METAYQIFEYLPLKYKNPSDTDFFSFPAHSIEQNYKAENYHFAVIALHMIYMGIVYYYIYGIFQADKKRFEYVLIGFHDKLQVKELANISRRSFANEKESTIFQFYRAVGIPNDQIGNLKAPVKNRNDILHTNGIYLTSEEDFEERAQTYLQNVERIHEFCVVEFKKLFLRFLDKIKIDIENKEEAGQYIQVDFIFERILSCQQIILNAQLFIQRYDREPIALIGYDGF